MRSLLHVLSLWPCLLVPGANPASAQTIPTPPSYTPEEAGIQVFVVRGPDQMQKDALERLHWASQNYPVPYAQEKLTELLAAYDAGQVLIEQVSATDREYTQYDAKLGYTPEGHPIIHYVWENNLRVIQAMEDKCGLDVLKAERAVTDYYVFLALHEWSHHTHGHKSPTAETIRADESQALEDSMGLLVIPGVAAGRFQLTFGETFVFGLKCYVSAGQNVEHSSWQSFMDWSMENLDGPPNCPDPEPK